MEENWLWIIFFVIVAILRGIGWLMRQLQGPQQAPRPGQGGPVGPGSARPAAAAGSQETPFQAMLRMLEEASQAGQPQQRQRQRQRPPQQQQQQQRQQQRQRQRQVPVARAVSRPRVAPQPEDHGGSLREHHLKSKVAERHLSHLSHSGHSGAGHDEQAPAIGPAGFWEALERLTPIQSAVIMADVLGPARHTRDGTPYGSGKS